MIKTIATALPMLVFAQLATALDHTHVTNKLNVDIKASTSYTWGSSQFKDRVIPPGGSDVDEYTYQPLPPGGKADSSVDIEVVAPNDGCAAKIGVKSDVSVNVVPLFDGRRRGMYLVDSTQGGWYSGTYTCPGNDVTNINNNVGVDMIVSIDQAGDFDWIVPGESAFKDRTVPANGSDQDESAYFPGEGPHWEITVTATNDGCKATLAYPSGAGINIEPIDGGATKGFTLHDSMALNTVTSACP